MRQEKINYYLEIAKVVSTQSKCCHRHFGAIIVKDDVIIATGYNGSVRGAINCGSESLCLKEVQGEEKGTYDNCPAIHGEMNAIINAARSGISVIGTTMFLAEETGKSECPCYLCRRFIIQAGILDVYVGSPNKYRHFDVIPSFKIKEDEWMRGKLHV